MGELREELTARRSDWWPPINFLKLHPLNARSGCCERVKEFVEGVILSLSTESIIRWNPPGGGVDGVASRLKAKVRQGFELSDQAKRYACCNSIQMQQLDY
ncbi:hypothetical protein Osc7112_6745 (plasmid) [Oscillatoria nigro-viridis PCC 7112]|uniref:Uncharacterized protein n=1 Tax=Phormidium nigroviride PCC 7112 TaxID=179408 RepID=K9VTF3_9CYAN|nr:hypothetical protein Osc7112_6745 [Oscillatoria nigro-viridis PCC 7112]